MLWANALSGAPTTAAANLSSPILIDSVLYDGYALDDADEAVRLVNAGATTVNLGGWRLGDGATAATLPGGTALAPGAAIWLARDAAAFRFQFGHDADMVLAPWPGYSNSGDEVVLQDATGATADALVYVGGDTARDGWFGPALVILDVMLPHIDGLSILRRLRQNPAGNVPVILLTARGQEVDRIAGLDLGADDYVTKPFSPAELVSRVRAVLRRAAASALGQSDAPIIHGELRLDPGAREVTLRGRPVELTATEFNLLWFLAAHPRQVFRRDKLLAEVWGYADYLDPSTVTVHIRRLREKIERDPAKPAWLQTVWGVGYKFDPEGE